MYNPVKLVEFGQDAPLGTIRLVTEQTTRFVWYMGDEGQIRTIQLNPGEWEKFTSTGTIDLNSVMSVNSDIWDESSEWETLDLSYNECEGYKSGEMDEIYQTVYNAEQARLWAIRLYLRRAGEDGLTAPYVTNMYENYQKGLCTLYEAITIILDDVVAFGTSDSQDVIDKSPIRN